MDFSTTIVAPAQFWQEGQRFRNLMYRIDKTCCEVKNGDTVMLNIATPFEIESVESKPCNTDYSTRFIVTFVKETFPRLNPSFVPMCTIILDTYRRDGVIPTIKVERFDNCEQILDFVRVQPAKKQDVETKSTRPKRIKNRKPVSAPAAPAISEPSHFFIIITQKMYKEYRGEIFTAYKVDQRTNAVVASGEILIDTPRDNEHFVYPVWEREQMSLKVALTICRYDEVDRRVSYYTLDSDNCKWTERF